MSKNLVFALMAIFYLTDSQAQYNLPATEILVASQVQKIRVYWHSLPTLSPKGKELASATVFPASFREAIYFLKPSGQIDSIHYSHDSSRVYSKDIFTYDQAQRLVKLEKITAAGQVQSSESALKTDAGKWHYRFWNQGQLQHEIICRPDSLVEQKIYHRGNSYIVEAYDFEQEIGLTTSILNDVICYQETEKWVIKDGKPIKLIYHSYRSEEGKEKTFAKEYLIREDGYLENYPGGHGNDPYWALNFYARIDTCQGLQHPIETTFKEDSLIARSPIVKLTNYDNTVYRHYYTFEYE